MFCNKTISIFFLTGFLGFLSLHAHVFHPATRMTGDLVEQSQVAGVPLTSQDEGKPGSTMSGTTRSGLFES